MQWLLEFRFATTDTTPADAELHAMAKTRTSAVATAMRIRQASVWAPVLTRVTATAATSPSARTHREDLGTNRYRAPSSVVRRARGSGRGSRRSRDRPSG